jgi:predicted DNA-binding protein
MKAMNETQITLRLPPETAERLQELKKTKGIVRNFFIVSAIEKALAEEEENQERR